MVKCKDGNIPYTPIKNDDVSLNLRSGYETKTVREHVRMLPCYDGTYTDIVTTI